jgi:hypothetical protein
MKIKVLAKHIRKGIKGSNCVCPIALALKEVYKTTHVKIFYTWGQVNNEIYHFPRKVQKFIIDFDKKKSSVKPFEFSL